MNTNTSEDRKVFAALAVAAADVLEHPACPTSLRDALTEVTSELTNLLLLSVDNSSMLRALAGLAESGDVGQGRKPKRRL